MSEVFLKILNMSIAASWLILAVLLLRLVFKRAPKWVPVLLWGIVAVRLLCPVSIESSLSLIPSVQTVPMDIALDPSPAIDSGVEAIDRIVNPAVQQSFTPQPVASANPLQIVIPVLSWVWAAGMAVLLLYTAISWLLLRRKLSTAIRYRENIYQSEAVGSPFVLGIRKPKIYLPFEISGQDLEFVIAHEEAHIRRGDHLWKPLGFLLLTVHWFNPLMWLAYVLLCRDIELACDEKVIKALDCGQRADYSQALVDCSIRRHTIAACPLAFGEVAVKERVKSVMNYRRPAFWVILLAVLACIAAGVCFLTDPPGAVEPGTAMEWFDFTDTPREALTVTVPEYPDVTFSYTGNQITGAEKNGTPALLVEGMPIWNAYFCDLTGDSLPELCATVSLGSGIIDERIVVYDYAQKKSYSLSDRGNYDYTLYRDETDGFLYAEQRGYGSGALAASGKLGFADGGIRLLPGSSREVSILRATVVEIQGGSLLVEPVEGSWELRSADRILVDAAGEVRVGDVLEIEYNGELRETYPAQLGKVYHLRVIDGQTVSETKPVEARWYLTVGSEGVASIELSGPNFSGGSSHANGSSFQKGEQVWLEALDGVSDLRGVVISARNEAGETVWSASIPDSEENKGHTRLVQDGWELTGGSASGAGTVLSSDPSGSQDWLIPCSYDRITASFGQRSQAAAEYVISHRETDPDTSETVMAEEHRPATVTTTEHQGIDLAAPAGTPILASRSGTVASAGYSDTLGWYVTLDHGDGYSSLYAHMGEAANVSPGTAVMAGEVIGAVGSSGISTGDHLHFAILYHGTYLDPASLIAFD